MWAIWVEIATGGYCFRNIFSSGVFFRFTKISYDTEFAECGPTRYGPLGLWRPRIVKVGFFFSKIALIKELTLVFAVKRQRVGKRYQADIPEFKGHPFHNGKCKQFVEL